MSKLFSAGDMLPLYGRASSLQGELQEKEKGATEVSASHMHKPFVPSGLVHCHMHTCQWSMHCLVMPDATLLLALTFFPLVACSQVWQPHHVFHSS